MAINSEMAAKMAPNFEPVPLAKSLLRMTRVGTLATLLPDGSPFASLTSVATDVDGTPIILVSALSQHTQNLELAARCSLLLAQTGKGDPLAHPRLTLTAEGRPVASDIDEGERVRRRYLARHPKAELYVDFADFRFWRLDMRHAYLNGGFARAWDGPADAIRAPFRDSQELASLAESAVAHMNENHRQAIALYATKLAKAAQGPWRVSGIDPDGLDLIAGDAVARVPFESPLTPNCDLRQLLVDLAHKARTIS